MSSPPVRLMTTMTRNEEATNNKQSSKREETTTYPATVSLCPHQSVRKGLGSEDHQDERRDEEPKKVAMVAGHGADFHLKFSPSVLSFARCRRFLRLFPVPYIRLFEGIQSPLDFFKLVATKNTNGDQILCETEWRCWNFHKIT